MKPQATFVKERALAQHCPELLSSQPSPEERASDLAAAASRLQRSIALKVGPQLGTGELEVECGEANKRSVSELYKSIGKQAANFLIECGPSKLPLIVSLDYHSALVLTERAFGGDALGTSRDIEALPRSAWLVLERLTPGFGTAFVEAGELGGTSRLLRSHENVVRLNAFEKGAQSISWPITIILDVVLELSACLAVPAIEFEQTLGTSVLQSDDRAGSSPDPRLPPFSDIPLPIAVDLTSLSMPVSKLARLAPGDLIPIAPAREVPITLGGYDIARGRIGTLDERVALNITKFT